MNNKYLLEKYDTLINEIQNAENLSLEYMHSFLKKEAPITQIIYEVHFSIINKKPQIKISDGINSLHPLATPLKIPSTDIPENIQYYIPEIEKQLQLKSKTYSYSWNQKTSALYIWVNTEVEKITKEDLLLFYCHWTLKKEVALIKIKIKSTISSLTSRDKIQTYIQKKQNIIQSLLDKLLAKTNPTTINDLYSFSSYNNGTDCLKLICQSVEKLIRYLETDYYQYLDKNGKVPYLTIVETAQKLECSYNKVITYYNQSETDTITLNLLTKSLSKILNPVLYCIITYNEIDYVSDLINHLLHTLKHKENTNSLSTLLLQLNFNSLDFFDYYTDEINKELEQQQTELEKIKLLYKYLKSVNQKYLYIQTKRINNLPSTKEQITGWIEEEIYYLNQKRILEQNMQNNQENNDKNDKILTGLSVPQLSYFFGLLVQSGIIQPPTQRAVFRFIANHFKTRMTNSISVDSLNSKYYNVETTTKNAVREKIIELLNFTKL
nr:hypothetical protein [uncultured Flavobacterium sp.]